MIINDINFNDLYQQHLKACNHYNLPPTKWDKKAPKMAENLVGKPSRYNEILLKAMNVQPNETVLDIGCWPRHLCDSFSPTMPRCVCSRLQPRHVGYGAAIQRKAPTK